MVPNIKPVCIQKRIYSPNWECVKCKLTQAAQFPFSLRIWTNKSKFLTYDDSKVLYTTTDGDYAEINWWHKYNTENIANAIRKIEEYIVDHHINTEDKLIVRRGKQFNLLVMVSPE